MGGRTDCWCERESVHVCTESASTARASPSARVGPLSQKNPIVSVFRHLVRRRGAHRRAGRTSRRRCGVCQLTARRCAKARREPPSPSAASWGAPDGRLNAAAMADGCDEAGDSSFFVRVPRVPVTTGCPPLYQYARGKHVGQQAWTRSECPIPLSTSPYSIQRPIQHTAAIQPIHHTVPYTTPICLYVH